MYNKESMPYFEANNMVGVDCYVIPYLLSFFPLKIITNGLQSIY